MLTGSKLRELLSPFDLILVREPSPGLAYDWLENEEHQATLAGLPAVVVPSEY
jgi:hypothetical protein